MNAIVVQQWTITTCLIGSILFSSLVILYWIGMNISDRKILGTFFFLISNNNHLEYILIIAHTCYLYLHISVSNSFSPPMHYGRVVWISTVTSSEIIRLRIRTIGPSSVLISFWKGSTGPLSRSFKLHLKRSKWQNSYSPKGVNIIHLEQGYRDICLVYPLYLWT